MALPKIQAPIFKTNLLSDNRDVKYRSFLVKEEKILLTAKESDDKSDIIRAFKQIATNCIINDDIDIEELPLFDLEYLFMMIRSKSQGNVAKIKIVEDDVEYEAIVNFDNLRIVRDEAHTKTIDLDGNVGVQMRYPSIKDLEDLDMFNDGDKMNSSKMIDLIKKCIDKVFDSNEVYPMKEATEEERNEFFDSLSNDYLLKIQEFFATFPVVVADVEYFKDKKKQTKEVRGASNFLS